MPAGKGTCRRCGKEIVWARIRGGRMVALDPAAPIFQRSEVNGHCWEATSDYLVKHEAVCPAEIAERVAEEIRRSPSALG